MRSLHQNYWDDVTQIVFSRDGGAMISPENLAFVEWLVRHEVPFVFVFTKTDKITPAAAQTNIAAFTARIAPWFEKPPAVFTCSTTNQQGRQDLLGVIDEQLRAINAESVQTPVAAESSSGQSLKAHVPANRKRRPDLNRPW